MLKKKILITGGAGFIGSHLTKKLLNNNNHVITIDNFDLYYSPNIKKSNIATFLKRKNFKFYQEDIRNKEKIQQIFKIEKPQVVIHLAAKVGVRNSFKNRKEYEEINIDGTKNILDASVKHHVNQFIFASSSSVYGSNKKLPFTENQIVESQISPYGRTKRKGEKLCEKYHKKYGLNMTCLRLFTVYGSNGRPDMAPYKLIEAIYKNKPFTKYGTGNTVRDFTFIEDIINGFILALEKNYPFGIFNIGSGKSTTLNELISTVENITHKKLAIEISQIQKGDIPKVVADVSKAKKLLGYKPEINLDEGMKRFIKWYRKIEYNIMSVS